MSKLIAFILFALKIQFSLSQMYAIPSSGFPGYGEDSTTTGAVVHPNWQERLMHTWHNFVRIDPAGFKKCFLGPSMASGDNSFSSILNSYPPVYPQPWNLNLNRAARAHGVDRLTCSDSMGGSVHNDCNSTGCFDRIGKFYSGAGGEIYAGLFNFDSGLLPLIVTNEWICDGYVSSSSAIGGCAADGSAGHRDIIMTQGGELGCGLAYKLDSTGPIATCDSSGKASSVYPNINIFSASHIVLPKPLKPSQSFAFVFAANFGNKKGASPSSALVYVNGMPTTMSLLSGVPSRGNYFSPYYTFSTSLPCYEYYFVFVTNGTTERYPASGCLITVGIGSCSSSNTIRSSQQSSWISTCTASAGPTPAVMPANTSFPAYGACFSSSNSASKFGVATTMVYLVLSFAFFYIFL